MIKEKAIETLKIEIDALQKLLGRVDDAIRAQLLSGVMRRYGPYWTARPGSSSLGSENPVM